MSVRICSAGAEPEMCQRVQGDLGVGVKCLELFLVYMLMLLTPINITIKQIYITLFTSILIMHYYFLVIFI